MKRFLILAAAIVVSLSSGFASATEKYPVLPDLDKQNVASFEAQAAGVRKEMEKGGRFEYIKPDDRATVENGLDFMHDLIVQNGTVAAMKEEDKVRLFNRQERINSILTNSDSQRIICEKADQPGTLFRATTCHTYAELQRRTRDSQDAIERSQNHAMLRGFGAGPAGH